jgi:sensor histidine kinase YesM
MNKIRQFWKNLKIINKIKVFTGSVFFATLAILLFDVWIIKLFMMDFNDIMEDNSKSGEVISALNKEIDTFDMYVHSADPSNKAEWTTCVNESEKTLNKVPLDYGRLGQERYALMFSFKTAYGEYSVERDKVIEDFQDENVLIADLYRVYGMQKYLLQYAQHFVDVTMKEGNANYQKLMPVIISVPFLVSAIGIVVFFIIFEISKIMNASITTPVLTLANASRKIAANDFFIDDIEVSSQDEIGELVTAFNKMKFATGEYIKALEDKRVALDQLHEQEMENLKIEKQLETMNLELLKSQINPHFLFNTLNAIAGTANLEDAPTTEQMIEALSSLFRYNLKTQAKETLLSQELKISKDYMYLQKMRFGERVQFEIDSEVDENAVIVPTFTFQPLLENAIIHGISKKVEGGKVTIKIRHVGGRLHINVEDTGVGMDETTLWNIKKQLYDQTINKNLEKTVGIGLGNICKRIRAMYSDGNFEITSKEGEGTVIFIDIPFLDPQMQVDSNV